MSAEVLASRWFKYKVAFFLPCHTVMVSVTTRGCQANKALICYFRITNSAAQFKGAKWVRHQSDTAADSQAPIEVTDSHKVTIFMGEFWLKKKKWSEYINPGGKKEVL